MGSNPTPSAANVNPVRLYTLGVRRIYADGPGGSLAPGDARPAADLLDARVEKWHL